MEGAWRPMVQSLAEPCPRSWTDWERLSAMQETGRWLDSSLSLEMQTAVKPPCHCPGAAQ